MGGRSSKSQEGTTSTAVTPTVQPSAPTRTGQPAPAFAFCRAGVDGDQDATWPGPSLRLRLDGAPAAYGHSMSLVGSSEWTGGWALPRAWRLHFHHQGSGWQTRIPLELLKSDVDSLSAIEFKFVLVGGPGDRWERGDNRKLSKEFITSIIETKGTECIVLRLRWEDLVYEEIAKINPTARDRTAVVVLGKRLFPDGTPTPDLLDRMKKAASVHKRVQAELNREGADDPKGKEEESQGEDDRYTVPIIITGGPTVLNGFVESRVMKRLLIAEGVPEEAIVEEPLAMTTVDNVLYVYELIESMGINNVVVITAAYHLNRARTLFMYMRNLGPPYMLTFSWEGHTTPISADELSSELGVESRVLAGLAPHLASFVPDFFAHSAYPPQLHPQVVLHQ